MNKSIGIDIGRYSIKVVEVTPDTKGARLTAFHEFPLTTAPGSDNDIEILDKLRNYLSTLQDFEVKFTIGLRQSQVTNRVLDFPFKERHNILKSLAFELEDTIPFSQDNAIFDTKIIHFHPDGASTLAVACPKSTIEKTIQEFRDAGIDPDIMSVESIAFYNCIEDWEEPPPTIESPDEEATVISQDETTMYLHIGHKESFAVFTQDSKMVTVHGFSWGIENVVQEIANTYRISFAEALIECKDKAFILLVNDGATSDQITFSETIKKSLRHLTRQLRLIKLEVESRYETNIRACYISGGGTKIHNLGSFITQEMDVACNRLQLTPKHIKLESAKFELDKGVVALGYAIEGLKKPRNPALNLLKNEFQKKNPVFEKFWGKWSYSLKIAALSFVVLTLYSVTKSSISQTLSDEGFATLKEQAKKVANLSGRKASIRSINKYIKEKKQILKNKEIMGQVELINSPLDILKEISTAFPSKKTVKYEVKLINLEDNILEIEGYLLSGSIQPIEESLKKISSNNRIKPFSSNLNTSPGQTAFAYKLNVTRKQRAL